MANNLQDGLFQSEHKSLYDFQTEIKDNRKHLGRDFTKDLLFRSISPVLAKNAYLNDFLILLQTILVKYINTVTHLKIYKSYTVDKNYKKVK